MIVKKEMYRIQPWKQDDMEGEAQEWVGWGPPVETLVRRTACEETAACQPDDCSCLPEHLMARQCHSVYGSRACLTSLLSMSPFYRFQQLVEDKSIGFPFESSGMNTGSVFIAWFLIDGFTLARLTEVSAIYLQHVHTSDVFDQALRACAQVPRRSVGIHLWSSALAFCLKSVSHLNLTNLSIQSPCLTLTATLLVFMLASWHPFHYFFFF